MSDKIKLNEVDKIEITTLIDSYEVACPKNEKI